MILSPGDRVDRYEVLALLGTGGMGEVYRARDRRLAREVALKLLRIDRSAGTEGAARLLREARAAAALSHANVLSVYDVGDVQEPERLRGLSYIAMELVVGKSLRACLGDETIPMQRRVDWLRDIASALAEAHRLGIVHRDVKPENVMIRADGVVKVLDFGIARRAAGPTDVWSSTQGQSLPTAPDQHAGGLPTLTGQGAIVGTPFYMAPEQLRGEAIDARADQFAWGVVAYCLLAGKVPWTGGTEPLAILSQILSVDPVAPSTLDARIPPVMSAVIMRTLQKRREARFPSMREVIAAMNAPAVPAAPEVGAATTSLVPKGRARFAIAAAALACGAGLLVWRERAPHAIPAASVVASAATSLAPAPECTTNADCVHAHGGEAWHCNSRRHACVAIASQDCKVYSEPHDAEAADVVWLGGMFPLHTDPDLICESRAADLARQDFAAALGPGAARTGALHARPIGLVLCDEGADAMRAARHLAEDVEAPAVIGFRSEASALTTIPTVFLPNHVLSFVSISQAPSVTRIPAPAGEPRLVWRSTLNRVDSAVPLARFISDVLEPQVRTEPGGIGARPMKVAAVWSMSANHDLVDGLFDALHYNGQSALANGASFRQLVLDRSGSQAADDVAKELVAFAPQVVVVGTELFFEGGALKRVEATWDLARGPRPIYLTESSLSEVTEEFAGRDASKRHRFFAAANVSSTPTNAKLVLRYNLAFPAEPVPRTEAPQPSYDAFYMLAYATYALGDGAVTGPSLARALERLLPPGPKIDVGPAGIFTGFDALRAGGRIDLNGALGSLDFDTGIGEAPVDYGIVCLGVDDHGHAAPAVDSGLVYDATAKKLVGALHCP